MSEHYKSHPSGIEAIEITQFESFLRGNIIKYVMRAPYKGDELADLEKAAEYLQWEIERVKKEQFWSKPIANNDAPDSPVAKRLSELKEMRGEWDSNGEIAYAEVDGVPVIDKLPKFQRDIYDYYSAGFISGKTFDKLMYPEKCQECNGDCKVCED